LASYIRFRSKKGPYSHRVYKTNTSTDWEKISIYMEGKEELSRKYAEHIKTMRKRQI
jgi:hypothetical protein